MWGFNVSIDRPKSNFIFNKIVDKELSKKYNKNLKSPKGFDQFFLTDHVYPIIVRDSITHDSYSCKTFNFSSPFPTKRIGTCFVGAAMHNTDLCLKPSSEQLTYYKCPMDCRPSNHLDWNQC